MTGIVGTKREVVLAVADLAVTRLTAITQYQESTRHNFAQFIQ
jgi:hypothetical protein